MRKFATLQGAQDAAAPGQYILVSYCVVPLAERTLLLRIQDASWSEVERKRPFHDVDAEIRSGWADLDEKTEAPCDKST